MPKKTPQSPTNDAAAASNSSANGDPIAKAPRVQHWKQEKLTIRYHDSLEVRPDFVLMAQAWGEANDVPVVVEEMYGRRILKIGRGRPRTSRALFFRETLDEMRDLGIGAEEIAEFVRLERERRVASNGGPLSEIIEGVGADVVAEVIASSPL